MINSLNNKIIQFARLLFFSCCILLNSSCKAKEVTYGAQFSGLDHLPEHMSIPFFYVNGRGGFQAGMGGSMECCVTLPAQWRPGIEVTVRWTVDDWKNDLTTEHSTVVTVEPYKKLGAASIHFLPDGTVRVLAEDIAPWSSRYPGPSYDTVLDKHPATKYKKENK